MKVFGIAGWKNAGKTGLTERLVADLTARGYKISTIKHTHHGVDLEVPGTDTYRHREAGAREVILSSPTRIAHLKELRDDAELTLTQLVARLEPCDLVLVEGFKSATHPKIEAVRQENTKPIMALSNDTVKAVAADYLVDRIDVPLFDLDDTRAIADFILEKTDLLPRTKSTLVNDCFALPAGTSWTPVETALLTLKQRLTPRVGTETIAVSAARGRVLARDHHAQRANPPAANSAVDGYAFAFADLPQTAQIRLPLVSGRAAAGEPFLGRVARGSAVRILTGALIPEGVDTVVLQEDVTLSDDHVTFAAGVKFGANMRKAGEDVVAGAVALKQGHRMRAPDVALLSALGVGDVDVYQRLRVGVMSTGDELADPGRAEATDKTYDANRPMLLSLIEGWGHDAVDLGRVGDDRSVLRTAFDQAAQKVDVIVTSGGASAGDEDHVSALLGETGSLHHWRIAIKPGRPLALAEWHGVPVFGLPGNPVAALVTTLIFGRPAFSVMAGADWLTPRAMVLPAAFTKSKKAGRREYLRARVNDDGCVEVFQSEGSGRISGLSWASGMVELPDEACDIRAGTMVRYYSYDALGVV